PQAYAIARPRGRDEFTRDGRHGRQLEHLRSQAGEPPRQKYRIRPRSTAHVEHRVAPLKVEDADQGAGDSERTLVHRLDEIACSSRIVAEVGLRRKRRPAGTQRAFEVAPRPVELVAVP